MAKKKPETTNGSGKPTEGEVSAKHNVANRDAIMREVGAELRRIKVDRKDLNEDAGEARKRLRDIAVEPKAFELALRIADLEDAEARNNYMTAFQESWDALAPGGQLDFVSAMVENPNQPDHEVTEPEAA